MVRTVIIQENNAPMPFKLDKIDRIILHQLDLNSRVTNKRLAGMARISEQSLNYRINRLLKNGVVKFFYAAINFGVFGYEEFRLYARLQNLTPEKEGELISYLQACENVLWIAQCRGHWDIVISFAAKNSHHFSDVYRKFQERFDNIILTKNIAIIDRVDHFNRSYLLEDSRSKKKKVYADVTGSKQADATDEKIIHLISHDSRMSMVEISRKLGISPDTVRNRFRLLEENGVILGYGALFNLQKIGYFNNIISIKLHYLNMKRISEFFAFTLEHKNIIFALHLLGNHDIDLEVEVKSQQELDGFISDLRKKSSDIIRDLERLTV